MAPRWTALLILALAAGALSARAQPTRAGGAASEAAVPGNTGASVQGSALQSAGVVPPLSLTVAPLTAGFAPIAVPQAALGVLPAAPAAAFPEPILAAPARAAVPVLDAAAPAAIKASTVREPAARDARTRRAVATIRATEKYWNGETVSDDDDPTHSANWASMQRGRAGALEKASSDARLGPIEGAIARAVWSSESKLLRARADRDERAGLGAANIAARHGVAFSGEERRILSELTEYVPGFNPDLVVGGEELAHFSDTGFAPGGYAVIPLRTQSQDEARGGFIWLGALSRVHFIQVAAHEGFHQGDLGYRDGYRALTAAFGKKDGLPLAIALLEGFTELRTREAMDRLGRDALAGQSGLPARYGSALSAYWGGTFKQAIARDVESRSKHGYDPYVKLAEAIIEKPGGRAALEAFVSRGAVEPLEGLLGRSMLAILAGIAAAADDEKSAFPIESRLAGTLGVADWIRGHFARAVHGEDVPDAARLRSIRQAAVATAYSELESSSSAESEWRHRAMLSLDLTKDLEAGATPEAIADRIRAAGRLPAWKRWIPPLPASLQWMLDSGLRKLAILYPMLGAFMFVSIASPGPARDWMLHFFANLAALGPLPLAAGSLAAFGTAWLLAELFGAWQLVTRPSRSLPWRWRAPRRR